MCGITAYISRDTSEDVRAKRKHFLELSKKIRHRGPDWNGIYMNKGIVITHERLSIVGVDNGSQPLINKSDNEHGEVVLSVNGEIYNHKELFKTVYKPKKRSNIELQDDISVKNDDSDEEEKHQAIPLYEIKPATPRRRRKSVRI